MSIYSILNVSRPTIGYMIVHQSASPGHTPEYIDNIRELHASVRRESEVIAAAYQKYLRETITRESQVLRGSLSEFLAMPVRSDNQSVQRIFTEGFERFQSNITGAMPLGAVRSFEGRFIFPKLRSGAEKKSLSAGKEYLNALGFGVAKTKGDVFESVFVVEGGMNLDLLEHIIRDRLGIYAPVHGTHLKMVGGYTFSAYNLIDQWSTPDASTAGETECAFHFSKPDIQYEPFRAVLHESLGNLARLIPSLSVWQRKLGLGKGKEFIVRCMCNGIGNLGDIFAWLQKDGGAKEIRKIFLNHSCLLVKELVVR